MTESSQTSRTPAEERSLKDKLLHEAREWFFTLAIFIPAFYIFSFLKTQYRSWYGSINSYFFYKITSNVYGFIGDI